MSHRERCHGGVGGIQPAVEQAEAGAAEILLEPDPHLHEARLAFREIPRRAAAGEDGVFGCRMTGGGFGGCAIALVEASSADAVVDRLKERLAAAGVRSAGMFLTRAAAGAHVQG